MTLPLEAISVPRFSIITPCFDRAEFIVEAVESVLSQNYLNFEHIVVDGGSSDGSLKVLKKYSHLKLLSEPDKGMYDALNKGLQLASGEIIGFLNSDDMYSEGAFNAAAEFFLDNSTFAVAGEALIYSVAPNGISKTILTFSPNSTSLLELSTIGSPFMNAWFFRKSVFKSIGNFNIAYQIVADRDFMLRFALNNLSWSRLDKKVYQYRQHSGSMTFDITDQKLERIASEHIGLTDDYLKQKEISAEAKSMIRELRSRDTIEMAFRTLKKLKIPSFLRYSFQGSKYDRQWLLKLIARILAESRLFMKKKIKGPYHWIRRVFINIDAAFQKILAKIIAAVIPARLMRNNQLFSIWENRGYHVTPVHFYEPIPDTRELSGELWSRQSDLLGIQIDDQSILVRLQHFARQYHEEYTAFPIDETNVPHQFYIRNGAFVSVDAEILYCMIREFKPRTIIEIGSGNTTYLAAQAIELNRQENPLYNCQLTAIEPYPVPALQKGFPGLTQLVEKPVQDLPLSFFDQLGEGDILFIDSSHVAKIGSDVVYEYLEILPRLNRGVFVHIHDIFLPAEYPKGWILSERHFWNEQYLFHSFLLFNNAFEVIWPGSYIHHKYPEKLEQAFPSYNRQNTLPGSFWIQRKLD